MGLARVQKLGGLGPAHSEQVLVKDNPFIGPVHSLQMLVVEYM